MIANEKNIRFLRLFKKNYLLRFKNIYVQNNAWNEKKYIIRHVISSIKKCNYEG
jgi:hypothetical protein